MKICPKCKNEYREGITYCADCGCELIEEGVEKAEHELLMEAEYPLAKETLEYLEYCKFTTIFADEPDEEGQVRLYCKKKEYKEALKQAQGFVQVKMQKAMEEKLAGMSEAEVEEMVEETLNEAPPSNVYQNYEDKAEEHKSSAVSFLIIGAIGLVVVVLSWFDMLPFSVGGSGNWFTHGILFAFFVIFVLIGVVSAKSVGKYKELASKEATVQSALEKYLTETFTYEVISEIVADTEEEAYFKRMAYMRDKVAADFPETAQNGSFVESLLDEHYDKIFG